MLPPVFTGLIQHRGLVESLEQTASGRRLRVNIAGWNHHLELGASISVDGCCLTVAAIESPGMTLCFDVITQTLKVTTLGRLKPGDRVNLEHAVTPTTLMGGHIVQGHVDGVGRILRVTSDPAEHRLRIQPHAEDAMGLIVDKGSIAVSGVSLTIAASSPAKTGATGDVLGGWFEVALIPTTLALTNLGSLREGDGVNLEYDCIAKTVVNWLTRCGRSSGNVDRKQARPDLA